MTLHGPVIILNQTSTILVEPGCSAFIDNFGNVEITIADIMQNQDVKQFKSIDDVPLDSIELSIFGHRFMSIAE
jgi:5-oxoprolinase (ATP-hydrolysing)